MVWLCKIKIWWKAKLTLLYGYRDSFIVHVKADGIYNDIAEDVETIWHFRLWVWKVIGVMKDELVGKIMKEFFELRAKLHVVT